MIEIENETSHTIDTNKLHTIASHLSNKEIELIITSKEKIQEINKLQRAIDKPTDVLSFPYENMPMAPLGSIVISIDHVIQKSQELHHSIDEELSLLFIHGLLHLLGYDHEVDNGEMREKEAQLIHYFHLPQSLIIRTQG